MAQAIFVTAVVECDFCGQPQDDLRALRQHVEDHAEDGDPF